MSPLFLPPHLSRRAVLGGGLAALAGSALPWQARAEAPVLLKVESRVIEVLGRAAKVYGVTGPDGRPGLRAPAGVPLSMSVSNATDQPLPMHWHGQTLAPPEADWARPGGGAIDPGAEAVVSFPLTPGTHWMHSHSLTEQQMLAAPMIGVDPAAPEMPEAVVMLHDFAFAAPEELLAGLGGSNMHGGGMMDHSAHGGGMGGMSGMGGMAGMGGMMAHANDIAYDAYLANDRTLDDPEVIAAEPGQNLRLRLINGATATGFWILTGEVPAQVVAVDGIACQPLEGRAFPMAQGQRIDLIVTLPSAGAFPIFAQVEDSPRRTGVILASAGAEIARQSAEAEAKAPLLDLSLDLSLAAASPLADRPATRTHHLMLEEGPGYRWTINGAIHGEAPPLTAAAGERVELMFMNMSMMMHPMHLHGHDFQVVDINGQRLNGPRRDTVIVPPMAMVTVALDAREAGSWYLHCHHLYHMATGMMTELQIG